MAATAILALSSAPGCVLDDDVTEVDSEIEFDTEELLDGVKGHSDAALLMLGSAEHGHLDRIADGFRVIDSDDLGLAKNSMSEANARQLMPQLKGIGLSLSRASDDDLATWKPLTDAALDAGVPVIIDNIKDPQRLAKVVGVGVEADLVMVTALGPNRHRVLAYGENSVMNEYVASSDEPGILSSSFAEGIDRAVDEITATLDSHEPSLSTKAANSEGQRFYEVFTTTLDWDLTSSQTAALSLGFEIQLVRDEPRQKKYVFIRSMGSGNHPGTLASNSKTNRGFYQESHTITIYPLDTSPNPKPHLYAHAPESPNNTTTYLSSTGWTVSVGPEGPTIGLDVNDIVSTTITDFSVTNDTAADVARWIFKMTTNWRDMFYIPLIGQCSIKSLPALATGNFNPKMEVIYRVPINSTHVDSYTIRHEALMRKIREVGKLVFCNKKDSVKKRTRTGIVHVDYDSV